MKGYRYVMITLDNLIVLIKRSFKQRENQLKLAKSQHERTKEQLEQYKTILKEIEPLLEQVSDIVHPQLLLKGNEKTELFEQVDSLIKRTKELIWDLDQRGWKRR